MRFSTPTYLVRQSDMIFSLSVRSGQMPFEPKGTFFSIFCAVDEKTLIVFSGLYRFQSRDSIQEIRFLLH
jgi:hypothetical protein